MTWLVWRQYRTQAAVATAILAAFAALLLVTGQRLASQYHAYLAGCSASHSCGSLGAALTLGSPLMLLLITLTEVVPCLLGVFWGGPLLARELETGTSQFAWTQSVTRRRWLTAKIGWTLLAAAVWAGAVSVLVTWWSGPRNALLQQNFQPGQFDIQDIVPVGYALFAVSLGIAAGALLRRTLPALAITLGVFVALRIVIVDFARPHYMAAITKTYSLLSQPPPLPRGSYWAITSGLVGPGGHAPPVHSHSGPTAFINGTPVSSMPSSCQALLFRDPKGTFSCLAAHGYHGAITYQPASRYWAFQGIETGIFAALAAALIAITVIAITRRDA